MKTSLHLEHTHHGNKLGGKIKKMYHFGTFSAQQNGEEKNEKQCCNAYISWNMIKMNLELLYPCLILARTCNMKEVREVLGRVLRLS